MKNAFISVLVLVLLILAAPVLAGDVPSLETAIKAWAKKTTVPSYRYAFVDLNDDGVEDAVVQITANDYCGSGGCSCAVFRGVAGGFKLVSSSTITREPILLLQEKRNGWHTLSVLMSGGGAKSGQVLMRFNGTKYPSIPSIQPKAKKNDLKGARTLISRSN